MTQRLGTRFLVFCLLVQTLEALIQFGRAKLLDIGRWYQLYASAKLDFIPPDIQRMQRTGRAVTIPPQWRRRRRRERKQKRGKRGSLRAKLHAKPHRLALPSLFLMNSRSLVNKMDEIRLRIMSRSMESCVMIITETWLDSNVPDAAIELAGRSVYRADRTAASGKSKGSGVCVYVHNNRCTATNIIGTHCSPDLEYLAVKCRPFYMLREFSAILITAVYIPLQANAKLALEKLYRTINNQLNAQPEAIVIVAGDFNHVELKAVLPKFHKNINFPTRGNNILDQVYTNIPGAYKAAASSHLGMSDHIALEMTPAYRPLICRTRPTVKTVQVWSEEATSMLQDCFELTDWGVFKEGADLEEYTSSVLAYLHFCTVLPTKSIKVFPNQKPWLDSTVRSLLKARDAAYRSGDMLAYSRALRDLKKDIRKAKYRYKQRTL